MKIIAYDDGELLRGLCDSEERLISLNALAFDLQIMQTMSLHNQGEPLFYIQIKDVKLFLENARDHQFNPMELMSVDIEALNKATVDLFHIYTNAIRIEWMRMDGITLNILFDAKIKSLSQMPFNLNRMLRYLILKPKMMMAFAQGIHPRALHSPLRVLDPGLMGLIASFAWPKS